MDQVFIHVIWYSRKPNKPNSKEQKVSVIDLLLITRNWEISWGTGPNHHLLFAGSKDLSQLCLLSPDCPHGHHWTLPTLSRTGPASNGRIMSQWGGGELLLGRNFLKFLFCHTTLVGLMMVSLNWDWSWSSQSCIIIVCWVSRII